MSQDLSLNVVLKSESVSKGFKDIENGMKSLTQEASKLGAALSQITIGKQANANHPDSFHKHLDSIRGALGGMTREAQNFHKVLSNEGQNALNSYSRSLARIPASGGWQGSAGSNGGTGMARYGGGGGMIGYGAPPGAIYAGGGGGGGFGGGPPPPSWFQRNGGWGSVWNGAMSGLQTGASLIGTAGAAFSAYGQYETAEKLGGLRNKVGSDTGFNQMMSMGRNAPPGYLAAILGQAQGYASGDKSASATDILLGKGKAQVDKIGTGAGILNSVESDDSDLRANKAGQHVSAIGNFVNSIVGMVTGAKGGQGATNAVGNGINSVVKGGGNLVQSTSGLANEALDVRQGGLEASRGRQMAETINLISNTAQGRALMDSYSTAHSTAQIRTQGSRIMGGEGNALSMFGMGGNLGFDASQSMGLVAGMRGQFGGRSAMDLAPQAMKYANKGFDVQSAGAMLGQMGESGPGGAAMLEKVMAAGIKQGMSSLDVMYFQKIGEAVASNSVGRNGSTGAISGALYSSGVGNDEQTMRRIKGNVSGLELANQIQQGNPFFSSRNLVNASSMLGEGASIRQRETLGGASIEDLSAIAAGTAGEDNALSIRGVTPEQAQSQLDFMTNNVGSVLTGTGDESDPLVKLIKDAERKSGSFAGAMRDGVSGKDSKLLNAVKQLGQETLGGADSEAFGGFSRILGATGGGNLSEFMSGNKTVGDVSSKSGKQDIAVETRKMLNEISIFLKNLKDSSDKYGNNLSKTQTILEALQSSAGKVTYNATEVALTAATVNIEGATINVNPDQVSGLAGRTGRDFGKAARTVDVGNKVDQASGKSVKK